MNVVQQIHTEYLQECDVLERMGDLATARCGPFPLRLCYVDEEIKYA